MSVLRIGSAGVDCVPVETGEFWTARQRCGHALHEISYRACFKPQLPEYFITRFSKPGDTVLDPFSGRGTTAMQAALMGRRAYASDANPLSVLLTRPRLHPPLEKAIPKRLAEIPYVRAPRAGAHSDLTAFFHPHTLRRILSLRRWFLRREAEGELDRVDDWIRMTALNRLTGHSPGFFSVRTMPPNQAISPAAQRKLNARFSLTPPPRDCDALILKKTASLLRNGTPPRGLRHRLATAQAQDLAYVRTRSVHLAITSPPFLNTVDYKQDNRMRLWFAGIKPDTLALDIHPSPEAWQTFVAASLAELARTLVPGGHLAFEVGEVRKGSLNLESYVLEAARGLPLEPRMVLIHRQAFTKTANCWGVANNRLGTNSNRIVVLQKAARA